MTGSELATPASVRIAFLGPEGTFSEEALLASVDRAAVTPVAVATIREAVLAVQDGAVDGALVPIENSLEGSVTATLDTLAGEADGVRIVGEVVRAVEQCLIAVGDIPLAQITTVVSHRQATGQCARFLREELPGARVLTADSTAGAVQMVAQTRDLSWAALGPRLAAQAYGCVVLRAGVEDHDDNETRFVWLARAGSSAASSGMPAAEGEPPAGGARRGGAAAAWLVPGRPAADGTPPSGAARRDTAPTAYKTSLVFWGPGADAPGWLVACLQEFASRDVNLTKIESRPRRERLGRYMFFVDAEGSEEEAAMAAAIGGLRGRCQEVRVLGSYPATA